MCDKTMLEYDRKLKSYSRELRSNMTHAEELLWSHLKNGQILNVKFYRQKPLLNYIVDFYSYSANLVIECDGTQHSEEDHAADDNIRDEVIAQLGITVLRFNNEQIVNNIMFVIKNIWDNVEQRIPKR